MLLPSAFPASGPPDFPSTGPRDLWPGPGGSTSGLWTRWAKAPAVQRSEQCGRDDLPQASALGFSFSFLKAGKAIFWPEHHVVLLRRFLQRRVTASVAAFLGKGKEPSKRGQDRLRKGNSAIGRAGRRGGQQDPPRGRKSLRGGGRGGEPPAAPAL